MPLIGYLLGSTVSSFVSAYAPYISFFLLAFVGVKMLVEAIRAGTRRYGSHAAEALSCW